MSQITKHKKIGVILGSIALALAILAFILGSAPFTPALALLFIAAPLALIAILLRASRLAIVTLYFSLVAWNVVPLARVLAIRIDHLLVIMGLFGFLLSAILFFSYLRANSTA
ncbi:hypothetical protein [Microbulbifer sp. THAF38]|uniref:hypothetical protein n=1 Tax=Microbulbifer sp. THAF38 TaxID=2587856 RepID=UPI001268BD67|nr:hypothetical protein [Microbulbifer sp. THAF38]QFT54991.1 hypothetical protein FIU95_10535 [Microbulbifer sp. THAF38]